MSKECKNHEILRRARGPGSHLSPVVITGRPSTGKRSVSRLGEDSGKQHRRARLAGFRGDGRRWGSEGSGETGSGRGGGSVGEGSGGHCDTRFGAVNLEARTTSARPLPPAGKLHTSGPDRSSAAAGEQSSASQSWERTSWERTSWVGRSVSQSPANSSHVSPKSPPKSPPKSSPKSPPKSPKKSGSKSRDILAPKLKR